MPTHWRACHLSGDAGGRASREGVEDNVAFIASAFNQALVEAERLARVPVQLARHLYKVIPDIVARFAWLFVEEPLVAWNVTRFRLDNPPIC